jgi:hypothetical protein
MNNDKKSLTNAKIVFESNFQIKDISNNFRFSGRNEIFQIELNKEVVEPKLREEVFPIQLNKEFNQDNMIEEIQSKKGNTIFFENFSLFTYKEFVMQRKFE